MKVNKIKILLLTLFFLCVGATVSKAGYSASNPTVESGGNATITVTSTSALDAYNLDLTSSGGLTFSSCSKKEEGAIININGSSIGYMNASGSTKTLGTYTFKTPSVTEKKTYTVTFSINQGEATVKSTVTVNPKATSSSTSSSSSSSSSNTNTKASVSKVTINGVTVKEYLNVTNKDSVSVKVTTSNGEGLKIYNSLTKKTVSASSGKAVTVPIMEGTNTLTITLNSGATATRKIYSKVEEETPGNFIEETEEDVKVLLKSLSIKGVKPEEEEKIDFTLTPEFSSEIYEYSIIIPEEHNDITKLDIEAIGTSEDFKVEITGNEGLVDGENIVTILVKSADGKNSATYKIIVNKEAKAVEAVTEPVEEVTQVPVEEDSSREIIRIVIIALTVIALIAGIIFAVVEYKYGKKHEGDDEFGQIPYANIGYEKEETDKLDVLEDLRENDEVEQEEKTTKKRKSKKKEILDAEDIEPQENETTKKKGKHF